jgi:16S rRNA G1207 methylase RsmC
MLINSSIWNLHGKTEYRRLTSDQKKEVESLVDEMRRVFFITRSIYVKQLINKYQIPSNVYVDEIDLRLYDEYVTEFCRINKMSREELEETYKVMKEEMDVAISTISGIYSNAKIWKGHRTFLENFRKQMSREVPLSHRQKDALQRIIHQYSKQIVTRGLEI